MRWSFVGSIGSFGSVHGLVILPSPLVSSTPGIQPCEASSLWVLSHTAVLTHPTEPFCPKNKLPSAPNSLWSVVKHVSISENSFFSGSYTATSFVERGMGKYWANLLLDPALQKSGCLPPSEAVSPPLILLANQTRPTWSTAALRGCAAASQMFSSPQYGEGISMDPSGIACDGIFISEATFLIGSSHTSELPLVMSPNTGPFGVTMGFRKSLAASACMYFVGVPHSHKLRTRLRSKPIGRGGASFGYSPAAMRSVQSANSVRCSPSETKALLMFAPNGPDFVRRSQASS